MPQFAYSARNAAGALLRGVKEGASASALADELLHAGFTPLQIRPAGTSAAGSPAGSTAAVQLFERIRAVASPRPKVRHEELLMFTRQMHTLLKSGIAMTRALSGLQESASPAMSDVIRQTRESLEAGNEISVSMAQQPEVFSPFYVAMVRIGESTGRLDEVFQRLFVHLEFEKSMREQVKTALRYPAFVVVAMVVAIAVVNVFVIPAFQRVFDGFGAELPLMTRVLVGFSRFTLDHGAFIVVTAAVVAYALRRWSRTPAGALHWDRLWLALPVAGPIARKATMARFARSFALALKSGVPVVPAMQMVAATVDNAHFAHGIDKMREGVERGDSVLHTAAASGIFAPVVLQMVAVGEESGTLDQMLGDVADHFQQEVQYQLKSLSTQIEPILICFLGALVLVLALGVFLPIWNLGRAAIH